VSDLVVGDVRGYRAWQLVGDGQLAALSAAFHLWESATKEAACTLAPYLGEDHPSPFMDCTCGLYAYYRATTVPPLGRGLVVPPLIGQVFGVVSVAGRVILATRGMRAERMTILAFVSSDTALGERYGVPIYPSRQALLYDYPPQDFGELVDVDLTDPPPAVIVRRAVTVGVDKSGFVSGMRKAAVQLAASAAMRVVARIVAAPNGVTPAEARRLLRQLSQDELTEVFNQAIALRWPQETGPEQQKRSPG
jgi:hypothetical protein